MKKIFDNFHYDEAWASSMRYLLALVPVALLTVKIKYSIVTLLAVRVISRSTGRIGIDALGFWEKLSLFSSDVLFSFIVFPVCCLLLTRLLPRRYRAFFIAALNMILFLLLFATWQCYLQTGRYYSSSTFSDSLWWVWNNPVFFQEYVTRGAVVQIVATILYICGASLWAGLRDRKGAGQQAADHMKYAVVGYSVLIVLTMVTPSLASRLPSTPYHTSVFVAAAEAFWGVGGENPFFKEYAGLGPDELVRRYRDLVHAPGTERDPDFWSKAKGYNVIFFIFETAPARVLRIDSDLRDLPVLRRLREKAFIGLLHHSTYPYTNRAWFSILSSMYPSSLLNNFAEKTGTTFPGIMRVLSNLGYATRIYYTPFQNDAVMFQSLGIRDQYLQKKVVSEGKNTSSNDAVEMQIAEDAATLGILKEDVAKWSGEQRRFCVAIGPQIGHAPWPELKGAGGTGDIIARGRATIALQDKWLGELVNTLERHGQLDKTIIVVTGDHGIRIRQEDPAFEGGMIDEYSFHVPLLIYVPQVLRSTHAIPWVTSHIDISPTILDLLGIASGRSMEQGSPVWDHRLQERVTYFFANHYLGADGFTDKGAYYMRNQVADAVYKNDQLKFSLNNVVPPGSSEYEKITDAINRMVALQETLGKKAGEPGYQQSRLASERSTGFKE